MASKAKQGPKAKSRPAPAARKRRPKLDRRISWIPAYIENADARGFFKFKNVKLRTLEEGDYERILDNEEQWGDLQTRLAADFRHPLEVFPYDETAHDEATYRLNWIEGLIFSANHAWAKRVGELTDIMLPRRYYSIMRTNLEERFPGGRVPGEPGDGDLRDLLTAFRQMFRENLAHYIYKKRQYQFWITLLFLALALLPLFFYEGLVSPLETGLSALGQGWSKLGASVMVIGILTGVSAFFYWLLQILFQRESENLFDNYKNCQSDSCKTLNTEAALRTKNLKNLITTMAARLGKDSTASGELQMRKNEDGEKWPAQAYRWTLLMYWLGRRMESIETFTQLQMWLIRRTHHFYRLFAVMSNIVLRRGFYLLVLVAAAGLVCQGWLSHVVDFAAIQHKLVLPAWNWLLSLLHQTLAGTQAERYLPAAPDVTQTQALMVRVDWLGQAGSLWTYLTKDVYAVTADALHVACGLALICLAIAYIRRISRLSADNWNTPLSLIRDNLGVVNWDRFHSANLPYLLAEQVRNDKRMILKREDWVKR